MCGLLCSVVTLAAGAALLVLSSVLGYVLVPDLVRRVIIGEVVLKNDSIQMERFQELPFPVNFTIRIFNMSNSEAVLDGAVPVMQEVGPWVYRLFQSREVLGLEDDVIRYRRHERFEFDPVASYPNTEDDMVTIVNVPYHAIIQIAELFYPQLASLLNLAMNGVFGEFNSPVATFRVRELLFDGLVICNNPGVIAAVACAIIRSIGATAQNLEEMEDGSVVFSVLAYKENYPSAEYEAHRGLRDPADLGRVITYDNEPYFSNWMLAVDELGEQAPGVCNQINGTDAGIFPPFLDRRQVLYAMNTDVCRSVEMRYQHDTQYEGIPALRMAANEWFMDNAEGCYCLNVTSGHAPHLNRPDGCLLPGAMELYTCVGAFMVLSYPHFLYADAAYRNGVLGMTPDEESHRIYMDIEPNTGTPVRGAKRAQFNIFMRPVAGIPATQDLRHTLVPFMWFEEGISLPEEFVDELSNRLLASLRLLDILIPAVVAASALLLALGGALAARALRRNVLHTAEPTRNDSPTTKRN